MGRKYFIALISILLFSGVPAFTREGISQEEASEVPPKELVEELLADEDIPEEIRREMEEALRYRKRGPYAPQAPAKTAAPAKSESQAKAGLSAISPSGDNKISLDLKGVDIIDVLKMLSARSDLNIVAGRNVRGRVTLFLKDVDAWDAFEIILAANGLAYEEQGNIINVMTERDYEQLYGEKYYNKKELRIYRLEHAKAAEVSKALNQAKSKIGKVVVDESSNTVVLVDSPNAISAMEKMMEEMDIPVETKIFTLNYARAEDIKAKVSEILTKGVGTIQVDERTNKIIVTDLTKKIPEIANVIDEMDEKHKEVLIEAKIVQISLNDQYQYGVDWKAFFRKLEDEGIRINLDNISGNVFSSATSGGALTITGLASSYFDAAIEALQTVGRTNVISSPRITVLNNEEAKVLVGTNQPYVTTSTTVPEGGQSITAETVTYIDVGVQLTVTPTINKSGYVTMKIKPEVSSLGTPLTTSENNEIPVVSTSETETTVMVKDGHTIVIAGLIEDRDEYEEDKIPILGDIPLIGPLLFSNKSIGSTTLPEKKELVVFLTPYIIHGTEVFSESENVWYGNAITQRELLEQQMSLAIEDLQRRRSLSREPKPPREEKDRTTRISEDLKLFGMREDIDELRERRARLREEIKPKKRGTIPDKVVTKREVEKETIIPPTNLITPSISGYYGYYENLRNRIYWVAKDTYPRTFEGRKEDVNVLFKLTNDGRLKGDPEVLNKVDKVLAKAATTAVERAAPFPPFPRKMKGDEAAFKITISYH